jgi:hypothetical protein
MDETHQKGRAWVVPLEHEDHGLALLGIPLEFRLAQHQPPVLVLKLESFRHTGLPSTVTFLLPFAVSDDFAMFG